MNIQAITAESCIVRNTASKHGRTTAVEPGRTAAKYLHYGRIILRAGDETIRFDTEDRETSLVGLNGAARIRHRREVVRARPIRCDLCPARFVD